MSTTLKHKNVIGVKHVLQVSTEDDKLLLIIMELCENGMLSEKLKTKAQLLSLLLKVYPIK